jgi:hypothetical protein
MIFVITFHYMDGETFETKVWPAEMEAFMGAIGKSEVYFNDKRGVGLWVPVDKVRYFSVERVDEQGRRVMGSDPKLPKCDGEAECGPSGVEEAGDGGMERTIPSAEAEAELNTQDIPGEQRV